MPGVGTSKLTLSAQLLLPSPLLSDLAVCSEQELRTPHFDVGEMRLTLPELRFTWKLPDPMVAVPITTAVSGATNTRQKSLFFPLSSSFPCFQGTGSQSPAIERKSWKKGQASGTADNHPPRG